MHWNRWSCGGWENNPKWSPIILKIIVSEFRGENMKNHQFGHLSLCIVHADVVHIFALTCRWSLWSVRTEDHKWSQQSRTWEDKHGRDRQMSSTHLWGKATGSAMLLLSHYWVGSWTLVSLLTYFTVQLNYWVGHLYGQVNNTLIIWNPRAALSRKISPSLTCFSCQLCRVKQVLRGDGDWL